MNQNYLNLSWCVVSLSFLSLNPLSVAAENSGTNQVTLDSLVQEALEKNPELNFYKAEIAATKGERRTATALQNPEVSTQVGEKRVQAGGDGLAWSVSVQQTFDWPGRIPLRKAIANRQIKLAELGLEQFRAAMAGRVRTLGFNLFAAQEKAAAAREVANRYQSLREVLVQRDPAGLTPLLETRIIEATELTLQRAASEAEVEAQAALLELNQLRGQPWQETVKIEKPDFAFAPTPDLETLLAAARTNNFEMQMRRVELEQQGFKISLAKNERYPAFKVGPYFSQENAGPREEVVGIGVSVPLPIFNRQKGSIATQEARKLQAETSLLVTQRDIERQVIGKSQLYQSKLSQMSKWRADSVQQFQEAAALAYKHYRLGAVPISTYVELQKQYLEAVQAVLDTKKEAIEAHQELQRLTGLEFAPTQNESKQNP